MKNKLLASILTACMLLTMLPTAAFAAETEAEPSAEQTAPAVEPSAPAAAETEEPGTEQTASAAEQSDPVTEDAVARPEGDADGAVDAEEPREETPPISESAPAAAADGYTDWTNENSLPTSGTYRLTGDVTIKPTFFDYATVTKSLVLDLAGHTVTVSDEEGGNYAYFVNSSKASLVIEDSVGGGKITNAEASGSSKTLIQISDGNFELKGGTLENVASNGYALFLNSSSTGTISGGTVINTAKNGYAVRVNSSADLTMTAGEIKNTENGGHAVHINGTAAFTMEGGKVTQNSAYSSPAAIDANNSATSISISGGEVVSDSVGVYAAFTPVSVTGGTFQTESHAFQTRNTTIKPAADKTVSVNSKGAVFYTFSESNNKVVDGKFTASALTKAYTQEEASTLTVSGGTFDIDVVASANDNSNIAISGGTFTTDVNDYLEAGVTQGQDGTVGKLDDVFAAEIWRAGQLSGRYPTLEAALEQVQPNDTVKLAAGKEISLSKPIEISSKVLILDLNGSTVKAGKSFQRNQIISVKAAGNLTIMDTSSEKTGLIADAGYAIVVSGSASKVTIQGGKVSGKGNAVLVTNGASLEVSGGIVTVAEPSTSQEPAIHVQLKSSLKVSGGTIVGGQGENGGAVNALSSKVELSGNAKLTGYSGIALFNVDSKNQLSNAPDAVSSTLTMSGGTIEAKVFALSGNNTKSAGSVATITGGSLTSTEGTAIYWPMEGELTVGGDAVITGGTGIEAKMGTITIQDNAKVTGTAAYKDDKPTDGGSSPEGSALLLSAQMYGTSGQYKTDNQLKVNITGGTLSSKQGNAVTVYNTEEIDVQTATVTVSGGAFEAEKAAIISVTKGGNTVTTTENTQTTSKSHTTLTVSGSVAPASIDANGRTTYYTNVTKAIQSVGQDTKAETQITVFGNATISTDVELNDKITLVVTPGTQLNADVTSSESGMVVVTEKDANGNTVYKLAATPANPEQDYVASITANGQTAYFQTLADAVKTVQDGQTITLLKDSTTAETITVSRALTFTLDPKTFTMKDTITAGSGFVLTQSGNTYTVSVYIPPVTPPQPDDRPSGGGSSSDNERTYAIVTEDDGHGSVTVSADEASAGTRITVTVKPDSGYALDELTVTDAKNKELSVTKRSETTYTFHMADSKVTVEASFTKDSTVQKPDTRFDDVAKSAWYCKAVDYVAENGIMSGVSAREFAPNAGFSRAMLAQTLYAMSGKPAVKAESAFADVAASAWYADAVNWAAKKGYVSGVGEGMFAPDASITREQMALILYRYAGSPDASGMALKEFADGDSVSAYAVDAVRWAVHEGLISGMENNTLAPQGTATRAQVAQILMNFHQKLDK